VSTNDLAKLASAIDRQTAADGGHNTAVPALRLSRFSAPSDLAAEAAFRVGYESPSQFGREYRRMFGAPPRQDVAAIRVET
jgi:AraC-like DNA-binding protein